MGPSLRFVSRAIRLSSSVGGRRPGRAGCFKADIVLPSRVSDIERRGENAVDRVDRIPLSSIRRKCNICNTAEVKFFGLSGISGFKQRETRVYLSRSSVDSGSSSLLRAAYS